ncbi:hypothetical protein RMS29_001505 [Agrobacterium rosae]|uniref:Gene transfer agent family protein n=1 Tax=Agrobacterium rosae TaxID=1972867 RepID=A0ABU4VYY5_9HYPH|nr:hypothetical protein [Agrobacterium rosae]MDX8329597.1 hypothetical protein [Agrobacterium rosae]
MENVKQAEKPSFKFPVNEARGEARLVIDGVELVIAAEMGRLAALSSRLQCGSLNELFGRLSEVEVGATVAGIELLTIEGDALAAIQKLKLKHFGACKAAYLAVLMHHFNGDEGNVGAAEKAAI